MTTASIPQNQPSAAQAILQDTAALRQDMATVLELARATALPMPGEDMSVIDAILGLLRTIVSRIEQVDGSLQALHQKLDQPGIANALRRMTDAD